MSRFPQISAGKPAWRVLLPIAAAVIVSVSPSRVAAATDPTSTFALAPIGAATGTVGGEGGKVVAVTNLNERGTGSLREAVRGTSPKIIVFTVNGILTLLDPIAVGSRTTIDGRGSDITLTGRGLRIDGANDVIVRNLRFDRGTGGEADAIAISGGSRRVWIDHNDLSAFTDGLVDVTQESTEITVSWNAFSNHAKVSLLGAAAPDGAPPLVDISLHHNFFTRTSERNPLMRHGRFLVWNDVIEQFGYNAESGYAIRVGCGAVALVEASAILAGPNPRAVTVDARGCEPGREPALRLEGTDVGGGAVETSGANRVPARATFLGAPATIDPLTPELIELVRTQAGWQDIPRVVPLPAIAPPTTQAPAVEAPGADNKTGKKSLVVGAALVIVVLVGGAIAFGRRRPR